MIALSELVAELRNSIAEEQHSLPDHPLVVQEIRARKARFQGEPASGITWEEVKKRIRSRRDQENRFNS
ncbi:addiction module protein [Pedosphaera parvula]|uniref:addiction module protein n=1 Tax=Pedosphaera parvula TaxID=1032527 RepID=UPI0002DBFD1E|nr:addiction module protein [Pedosphaera parvula]